MRLRRFRQFLQAALTVCAASASAAEPELGRPLRFHDPSTPIKQGDVWHVFSTGIGVLARRSPDARTWTEDRPIFQKLPAWHREIVPDHKGYLWAPDVIRRGDRFLLYYSVSGWGKNTSAIGLASSPTLDSASPECVWKDEGIVIRSKATDDFNAIDPQLFADADGSLWMVFGSFWSGIQLIELDPKSGQRHAQRQEIRQLAWNETIEAPALHKHGDFYYLFVNWGFCCRGLKSTYEMRVGRSRTITGPYLDAEGKDLASGGGTLFMKSEGEEVGPGHPAIVEENGKFRLFYHYYSRKFGGQSVIAQKELRWTADSWPKI